MNTDLYHKLVDLYAGQELPEELESELAIAAQTNPELQVEMLSLRDTVNTLRNSQIEFLEESYQRILMKLYARGASPETRSPDPMHLQYQLPMQG